MISAEDIQRAVPRKTEDARELQLRLYREIGISAVAAALDVRAGQSESNSKPDLSAAPSDLSSKELAA